ncbi:MAG: hypothetical protein AB1679_11145 [Actinomycetota bacterium]
MTGKPKVIFVCYQNAGRSRMAEAYLAALAGDRYESSSAGLEPADHTHPEAIQVMAEDGLVVDDRPGKRLTPELAADAVRVVAINCTVGDLGVPVESWDMPDGPGDKLERARAQRDGIRSHVAALVGRLERDRPPAP